MCIKNTVIIMATNRKKFVIDQAPLLELRAQMAELNTLIAAQLKTAEELRVASQSIPGQEARESTGNAVEFAKNQTRIAQRHAALTMSIAQTCKAMQDDIYQNQNDLHDDIVALAGKYDALRTSIKPLTEAGIIYKHRKTIIAAIIIGAGLFSFASAVLTAIKSGVVKIG